jgi:hypothetical protein
MIAMKKRIPNESQRGFILIVAMLVIASLLGIGMSLAKRSMGSTQWVRKDYQDERVFYVADGGADYAEAWLNNTLKIITSPTQAQLDGFTPPYIQGFRFAELSLTKQALRRNVLITDGPNRGLSMDVQPYLITSHAANFNSSMEQLIHVTVNRENLGLYQFGMYFEGDLELFPGYPLDYMGRIHTNGDLYVGSHNTLDIDAIVTVAGHIYDTPKDPTMTLNGKARFMDDDGIWHDLSYDWRDPNWISKAMNDWDGRVQDSSMGVTPLPMPIPVTASPHDLIERPVMGESAEIQSRKYYYKAGLRIVDGGGSDSLGNPVVLPAGLITTDSVYDYREQRFMTMWNLNMGLLDTSGIVPVNRVFYFSNSAANSALRIQNGSALPTGGLLIATDNPVYVQGDFNTINKQPSSIFCDAFNVYSNNWDDAEATLNLNMRIAAPTWVNTCVVTGNEPTTPGHYNGGAENIIRLHEKWVGHHLTYRGSIVCIWESEQATGLFENASYVESQRDWAFDVDLLDPDFWPDHLGVEHIERAAWMPY